MSKKLIVERDVETPMRDGVVLRADVYRQDSVDPLPVLLQRTPYGKGFSQNSFALMAAERGYAVVIQDTRGMWASDGQGYPFIYEREDGYDSVNPVNILYGGGEIQLGTTGSWRTLAWALQAISYYIAHHTASTHTKQLYTRVKQSMNKLEFPVLDEGVDT